jgi:3-hydroxy-9,10-secoandrosta-1,3,5(10)-triene-9,17-dione monooxygenase reductase component
MDTMAVERRAFRDALGQFATGVTVIAVEIDGTLQAMTANSFTSLSLDPPLVLFCIGKATRMGELLEAHHAPAPFDPSTLRPFDRLRVVPSSVEGRQARGRPEHSTAFSVNILRYEQRALSTYFAGAWKEREPPPFSFTAWDPAPRLEGCAAAVGCTLDSIQDGGDHWIVIGRVLALYRAEQACPPLVFFGGRYTTVGAPAGGENLELTYLISGF